MIAKINIKSGNLNKTGKKHKECNAERGRTEISDALVNGLQSAHENKPMSYLPQIWTDYKRDELVNIYKGKGTQKEKERIYDLLMSLNASQNNAWENIKK